ncbi:MAG: hypothetical protein ABIO60_08630 [Aquaticitalea sp.]
MKFKIVFLNFILLLIMGCKQKENKKENITDSKTGIISSNKISDNIMYWVDAINNKNTRTLKKMYASNAVKVISADSIINSSSQIAKYYGIHNNSIISIESLFSVEANIGRRINYELVKYKTESLKDYIQLVIWRLEDEKIIREFEFTKESTLESTKVDTTNISEKRKLWIELCNTHNSENLVKQLYSKNAIYFNHKPIVKGIKDLIKEYDYMNNKDYTLNLQPLKLEVVNADFAIEIGQCIGSYNGKYILVWKKQADGNWKIDFDSNI